VRRLVLDETESLATNERDLVERAGLAVEEELDLVRTRLLDKKPELFSTADRQRAEGEFRLAVVAPLLALAIAVAVVGGVTGFVVGAVLMIASAGLLFHGLAA